MLRNQSPQQLKQLEQVAQANGWDEIMHDVRDARQVVEFR